MEELDLTTVTIELKNGSEYELNLCARGYELLTSNIWDLDCMVKLFDWVPRYGPSGKIGAFGVESQECIGYRQDVHYIRISEIAVIAVHSKESE